MLSRLFIVLALFSPNLFGQTHYWIAEVIKAETVYEPTAEYQYHVKPLGTLYGDESGYVTHFTIPSVISHKSVQAGSWLLIRRNVVMDRTVIIEVQSPDDGFVDSEVFYEIYVMGLVEKMKLVDAELISHGHIRALEISMILNGVGGVQLRYAEENKNLFIVAMDYYIRQSLKNFLPFIPRRTLWSIRASAIGQTILVTKNQRKFSRGKSFSETIDANQSVPKSILDRLNTSKWSSSDKALSLNEKGK